jgi:hypothetical protein
MIYRRRHIKLYVQISETDFEDLTNFFVQKVTDLLSLHRAEVTKYFPGTTYVGLSKAVLGLNNNLLFILAMPSLTM